MEEVKENELGTMRGLGSQQEVNTSDQRPRPPKPVCGTGDENKYFLSAKNDFHTFPHFKDSEIQKLAFIKVSPKSLGGMNSL